MVKFRKGEKLVTTRGDYSIRLPHLGQLFIHGGVPVVGAHDQVGDQVLVEHPYTSPKMVLLPADMLARLDDLAKPASILGEAEDIVSGARQTTHGTPERSLAAIADLWNAYLKQMDIDGDDQRLSSRDVALMMALLKIARTTTGEPVRDHFVDLAGYAALAFEASGAAA